LERAEALLLRLSWGFVLFSAFPRFAPLCLEFRDRHSSSGFSQTVDAAAGSSLHFMPTSTACEALLTRYGAHRLVPLFTGHALMGFGAPFGALFFSESRPQFRANLPACCFAQHLACAFYGAT
jgi:hypothetical protein